MTEVIGRLAAEADYDVERLDLQAMTALLDGRDTEPYVAAMGLSAYYAEYLEWWGQLALIL